jgi:hypothetical protein
MPDRPVPLMKRAMHRLRRGHWPDYVWLGPHLKCMLCNFGTPTTRGITRREWVVNLGVN